MAQLLGAEGDQQAAGEAYRQASDAAVVVRRREEGEELTGHRAKQEAGGKVLSEESDEVSGVWRGAAGGGRRLRALQK